MSFPHRTAFYVEVEDEIVMPNEAKLLDNDYIVETDGKACVYDSNREHYVPEDKLIPLASTGLGDSEGKEIFEGHIVEFWATEGNPFYRNPDNLNKEECEEAIRKTEMSDTDQTINELLNRKSIDVIKWNRYGFHPFTEHPVISDEQRIVGHALTDPDLVLDSFDVEEYFHE